MKKLTLSIVLLVIFSLSLVSNDLNAGPRDGGGKWVTKCYHYNVSATGSILDSAYLGELPIAFIQCEDNPFFLDKVHQHHITGIVIDEDGYEVIKPPFTAAHHHPNCVIDSTTEWEPGI